MFRTKHQTLSSRQQQLGTGANRRPGAVSGAQARRPSRHDPIPVLSGGNAGEPERDASQREPGRCARRRRDLASRLARRASRLRSPNTGRRANRGIVRSPGIRAGRRDDGGSRRRSGRRLRPRRRRRDRAGLRLGLPPGDRCRRRSHERGRAAGSRQWASQGMARSRRGQRAGPLLLRASGVARRGALRLRGRRRERVDHSALPSVHEGRLRLRFGLQSGPSPCPGGGDHERERPT
jgi:hypothetical protein